MKTIRKSTKGLISVEVIIVVAIIALFAVIVVPNYFHVRNNGLALNFAAKELGIPRSAVHIDLDKGGSATLKEPLNIYFKFPGMPGGETIHTATVTKTSILTLDGKPYVKISPPVPANPVAPAPDADPAVPK